MKAHIGNLKIEVVKLLKYVILHTEGYLKSFKYCRKEQRNIFSERKDKCKIVIIKIKEKKPNERNKIETEFCKFYDILINDSN